MKKLKRILLIDDDSVTNYLHKTLINELKIAEEVISIDNGEDAFQIVKQNYFEGEVPDLIFLDINMPIANGFEFLDAFKLLESLKGNTVLVILTSSSLNKDLEKVKSYGEFEYVVKPLTTEKLEELFGKYFS